MSFMAWLNLWLGFGMSVGLSWLFYHLAQGDVVTGTPLLSILELVVFIAVSMWYLIQIICWRGK